MGHVPRPRPVAVAAALVVHVLPLGAAVGFLVAVGLPVLALALVCVEAGMVALVALARRAPRDG